MTTPLTEWPRPMWAPKGGEAWVLFVLFGDFPAVLPACPRAAYRTAGMPAHAEVRIFQRPNHAEWIDGWVNWPPGEILKDEDPALFAAVSSAPSCMAVELREQDPNNLAYMRDLVGMVTFLLDQGGTAVLDPQTLRYFSPQEWRDSVFGPGMAAPRAHVAVLASQDEDDAKRRWYHTRGLRKFGRPDLSFRHVPEELFAATEELFNRMLELQILGGIIPEGQEVTLPGLPNALACFHRGDLDDPEFNNRHIEIAAP